MKYFMLLLAVGVWGQTQYYPPPSGTGSFTAATEAEAIAGTSNVPGMTPLRVADAIKANVEGGDGVTCTTTTAGVECAVNGTVVRVSSGLASAKPGSCTALSQVYVASDTGAVYWCDGDTYEVLGTSDYTRLCTFSPVAGIDETTNVSTVTACSIAAGTFAARDYLECRVSWMRDSVGAGADVAGATVGFLVSTATATTSLVHGGHVQSAAASSVAAIRADLTTMFVSTSSQINQSTANASTGSFISSGGVATGVIGTLDVGTDAFTVEPRFWSHTGWVDDTWLFAGGSCWRRKAN